MAEASEMMLKTMEQKCKMQLVRRAAFLVGQERGRLS